VCWIEEHTEARFLDPRVAYEALIGLICPSHDAPFHDYNLRPLSDLNCGLIR
jgi:hypothetical protein